jgi:hypothetical protein
VELRVVQAVPVEEAQKTKPLLAALEILHQHHRPKVLMAVQLLPVLPKVDQAAAVHLLQEQAALVLVL